MKWGTFMEEVNLVTEALKFMALGMGIVFLFLFIMILVLKSSSISYPRFFLKPKEELSQWKPQVIGKSRKDTIAAISAAIIHYNNQKG